ncbi:ATP-binding protein [Streptomyces sp. NPDC048383]|uniref:ATP-binding protein n=1 Tax=unclassified Streptomyces TaxID=2593676 RepID=UPI0034468CD4
MNALTIRLLAVPKAAPLLRHAVREHIGEAAGCPEAELCVSELLSNVITHLGEGTPVTLRVSVHGGGAGNGNGNGRATRTRVELTDPAPHAWPLPRQAGGTEESGRGLALLDAVTLRWGVTRGSDTKTVWCEL